MQYKCVQCKREFSETEHGTHARRKFISCHLTRYLLEHPSRYYPRSINLYLFDTVRVMRGDYKGLNGRVVAIDQESGRVSISPGISDRLRMKVSVIENQHHSKLEIIKIKKDRERMKALRTLTAF